MNTVLQYAGLLVFAALALLLLIFLVGHSPLFRTLGMLGFLVFWAATSLGAFFYVAIAIDIPRQSYWTAFFGCVVGVVLFIPCALLGWPAIRKIQWKDLDPWE